MSDINFGLKTNPYVSNDFEVALDDKGGYNASYSFVCPWATVQNFLPEIGAHCAFPGWEFLLCKGWRLDPQTGGIVRVNVFLNAINVEEGGDEEALNKITTELQITESEEPIESHYRYRTPDKVPTIDKQLISDIKAAFYERKNKTDENSADYYRFIHMQFPTDSTKERVITNTRSKELVDYILSDVLTYRQARQIWRESYKSRSIPKGSDLNMVGHIADPKKAPAIADDRNWLFNGMSVVQQGEFYQIVKEYELSGRGGWDEKLYGDQN